MSARVHLLATNTPHVEGTDAIAACGATVEKAVSCGKWVDGEPQHAPRTLLFCPDCARLNLPIPQQHYLYALLAGAEVAEFASLPAIEKKFVFRLTRSQQMALATIVAQYSLTCRSSPTLKPAKVWFYRNKASIDVYVRRWTTAAVLS